MSMDSAISERLDDVSIEDIEAKIEELESRIAQARSHLRSRNGHDKSHEEPRQPGRCLDTSNTEMPCS